MSILEKTTGWKRVLVTFRFQLGMNLLVISCP